MVVHQFAIIEPFQKGPIQSNITDDFNLDRRVEPTLKLLYAIIYYSSAAMKRPRSNLQKRKHCPNKERYSI